MLRFLVSELFGRGQLINHLTLLHCDGLALGVLVALWVRQAACDRRSSTGLVAGALGMAAILIVLEGLVRSSSLSFAIRITELDLMFAAGVLAAYALRGSRFTALLRSPLARFFADTSYCVYLIHVSLLAVVDRWGVVATLSPLWAGLLRGVLAYPLTFALAALSRKYLGELPFLRLKAALAPPQPQASAY